MGTVLDVDVTGEVAKQRRTDRRPGRRAAPQAAVRARMAALLVAQRARLRGEPGAGYELREAAICLAAACEELARTLPAPTQAPDRK